MSGNTTRAGEPKPSPPDLIHRSGAPPGKRRRPRAAHARPSRYRLTDDGLQITLEAPLGTAGRELAFGGLIPRDGSGWELAVNGFPIRLTKVQLLAGPHRDPLRTFCVECFLVWPDRVDRQEWRNMLVAVLLAQARLT